MENLYGQRMTSKHASRRPGTRDDKTQANLAPPLAQRAIRRSRISKSNSDLVAHNSGSWGVRLLHDVLAVVFPVKIKNLWIGASSASQIAAISWTNLQNRLLWTVCLFGKRPVCIPRYDFAKILFCHNIILPKYDFAKISFCQSLVLPQYHFAKMSCCLNIVLPKYKFPKILWCSMIKLSFAKNPFARICLQNDRPKSSQNNNLGRPQTPHFAQSPGVMVPLGPSSPVIATTSYPNIFQIPILAWGDGSTGTIVLF